MLPSFFKESEQQIQENTRSESSTFFNNLINKLESSTYDSLKKYITQNRRSIDEIQLGFHLYPGLLCLYLIVTISRSYGDHFKIYPYLEEAFNISFTEQRKRVLWKSFRSACRKLDFDVSPRTFGPHFMVNEYLRQCGYPLHYVDLLVNQCIRLGNQVGFPDKDDVESLRIWHEDLLRSFNVNYPKPALRILENDFESYYIQNILEVLDESIPESEFNEFQKRVIKALGSSEKAHSTKSKSLDIPRVVFKDGLIGVHVTNPSSGQWKIMSDNSFTTIHDDTTFFPLDNLLTTSVTIFNSKLKRKWKYNLWPDDKTNRMLLFHGSDDRFLNTVSFNTDEAPETPLTPGRYILLTRFNPNHPDLTSNLILDDPEIFETYFSLAPGQLLEIKRGPALLALRSDDSPVIDLVGIKRYDLENQEFFLAKDLQLNIQLPADYLNEEISIRLRSKALGDPIEFSIIVQDSTQIEVNLQEKLAAWEPGVTRLVVECRKSPSKRVITRYSAIIWNGLEEILESGKISCTEMPQNFDHEKSKNFSYDQHTNTFAIKEFLNKTWSTVFNDDGTIIKLIWGRPGVTILLRSVEDGKRVDRSIPEGSTLSIHTNNNEQLMLFGLGEGTIKLGSDSWRITHNHKHWKASLLSLIDRIDYANNTLIFESSLGTTKELLRFVTPHNIEDVQLLTNAEKYSFSFKQADKIEGIWIQATNLISGAVSSCYFDKMFLWSMLEHFTLGGEVTAEVANLNCTINFCSGNWPDGLWKLVIYTRSNNRWGEITNERLDKYHIVIPVKDQEFITKPTHVILKILENSDIDYNKLNTEIYKILLECHSYETWFKMDWIEHLWLQLLNTYVDNNEIDTVMQVLDMTVPDSAPQGWIPMIHPAWSMSSLFSLDPSQYTAYSPQNTHLALCVHNLKLCQNIHQSMQNADLHPSLGLAFTDQTNFKNFSLKNLLEIWSYMDIEDERKILRNPNWKPGLGHYLGPLHLRYALNSLQENFLRSQTGEGNIRRRSGCQKIAQRAVNYRLLPNDSINASIQTWEKFLLYGLIDLEETKRDTLYGSAIFITTYAYLCRKSNYDDTHQHEEIKEYLQKLLPEQDNFNSMNLGGQYIISCGEVLLGYYLMLWELIFNTGFVFQGV